MAKLWYEKTFVLLLLVIFGGVVLHAPLSVWLGTIFPEQALLIKGWKELLLAVSAIMCAAVITKHRLWGVLFKDKLLWLVAAIGGLHIVYVLIFFTGWSAALAGLAIDLRYLLFFSLVYVLAVVFPAYRPLMIKVGVVGAVVVVGFAVVQLFLPPDILTNIGYSSETIKPYLTVDENEEFVRINSTLRGPNPLGAYTVIVLALAAAAWARAFKLVHTHKETAMVALLTVGGVLALWQSYSRSALIAALVALGLVGAVAVGRKMLWRFAVPIAFIVGAVFIFFGSSPYISTVLFHDSKETGGSVTSDEQHAGSLQQGINQLTHQPLGSGVGTAGSASLLTDTPVIVESQYFFIAHEVGAFGLLLFLALFVEVLRRLWRRRSDWLALGVCASGVGLGLIGILLPVWVDDTVSIVWWGLAGLVIGGMYGKGASKQKATRTA